MSNMSVGFRPRPHQRDPAAVHPARSQPGPVGRAQPQGGAAVGARSARAAASGRRRAPCSCRSRTAGSCMRRPRSARVSRASAARRAPGDGITERVIDTGKPVVVPRVSQEPALAPPPGERAKGGRELTYVAVPIAVGRRPGGTLEVVLPFKQDRDYQRSLEFYRVVASMIAQALKLRRTRRGGSQPPRGRERAPSRRAARPLCVPQHHRQQRLRSSRSTSRSPRSRARTRRC